MSARNHEEISLFFTLNQGAQLIWCLSRKALSKNTLPLMKKKKIKGSMTCLLCSLSVPCAECGFSDCAQKIYIVNQFETPIKTKSAFPGKT